VVILEDTVSSIAGSGVGPWSQPYFKAFCTTETAFGDTILVRSV